jgi:AcrR family transcriptional regulator
MTKPAITRKRRPDARPREILDAALDLFSEKGFSATRLEDVASRAGLSKAAIYLYFNDKTSLLKAVVETVAIPNLAAAGALVAAHKGPVAPLLQQLLGFLASRMRDTRLPDLIKLVIGESRAHPEIGRFYLEHVIGKALPLFEQLIARGIASGEFRAVDPRLTVKCLIGPMLLGAIWKSVFEPIGAETLDIEALARQHGDLIVTALRAAP